MINNIFKSSIKLKIKGKNIERFIRKLIKLNIDLLNVKILKYDEAIIKIYLSDYNKVEDMKTIYEIEILKNYGFSRIKQIVKKNNYLLFFLLVGLFLLYVLSNIIFEIEIVHNNKEIRNILTKELNKYGIREKTFKKKYLELQKIKKNILNDYKEKIEWLEIEEVGTKYIVKVEERVINKEKKQISNQDIVAKKSAILLKVEAESGEIIKNINDYVEKGETVITGNIKLYDEIKKTIGAKGKIYGEVWYKVNVSYPLHYEEKILTGNKKNDYVLKLFNKEINLINFNKYKNKKIIETTILTNGLIPIKLVKQKQREIIIINENYTNKEAIVKATNKAISKIKSKLNDNEYIINYKQLKINKNNSKMELELFFSVCEDITDTKDIIVEN